MTRHPDPTQPARTEPRDRGAALILTLFATTLVMIVGTTILTVTVNNLRTTRLSQDSASALDAADAGLAQASAHLRTYGVGAIACSPDCASGYGSEDNPTSVSIPGGAAYEVWVEAKAPLPANNPGRYVIHSTGTAGDGRRTIEAEVAIGTRPLGLPLALFAKSFHGGGNGAVFQESILTTGCVWSRKHINISGTDVAYKIPAAVHSAQHISTSNAANRNCGPSNGSIHPPACPSDTDFRFDQDAAGGPLESTSCSDAVTSYPDFYKPRDLDGDGSVDVDGSWIRDEKALRTLFSIPEKPFTDTQLDTLRAVAKTTNTYFTTASYTSGQIPDWSEAAPHLVVFFDLEGQPGNQRLVDLKDLDGWTRPTGSACPVQSLVIVIVGGDARLNGTHDMVANLVLTSGAPYGYVFKANGTANMIGTIYADQIDLTGTVDISLDDCFVQNLSPSLVDTTLTLTNYREIDR